MFYGKKQKKTRVRRIARRHVREVVRVAKQGVKKYLNVEFVKGHINVELAKHAKRCVRNQRNVVQDKHVQDKHLAVNVKKDKVHRVNKYA